MRCKLYANYRLIAGTKIIEVDLPDGSTVRQLINAVIDQRPVLRPHWLDATGDIHSHVHIFINGHDLRMMEGGVDTPLQPIDVLDFFPPIGGGACLIGR